MTSTKGKTLYFNDKSMDYVIFGKGKKHLVIMPECRHALYEQNKDFQKRVLVFLES